MDLNLDPSKTVADVVLRHSECAEVFQRHRIDYCCRGDRSVAQAARERGVDVAVLMRQLDQAIAARRDAAAPNMQALSTAALIEHIVDTHHAYLRKTLPFLRPLAMKVARVHGDRDPRLHALEDDLVELVETLLPHLDDEERTLFPALRAGVAAAPQLLATMLDEHLAVGELLARIRTACDDYTVPSWACSSYRALFRELAALEQDIFTHVHLENHVLLPRFEPPAAAQRFELASEAVALEASPAWREVGHTAKTLLRKDDTRVVLIALRAGARMIEHKTDHSITVQVLSGRVQLATPRAPIELAPLGLAFLDAGVPHDLVAFEDSRVLLTINWHPPRA